MANGALHIHSNFSRDGRWSIAEAAEFFRRRRYQFVCMAEHAEDLDVAKAAALRAECAAHSRGDFLMVPGIEFDCSGGLHIAGYGCDLLPGCSDPVRTARAIADAGGFAVLAHPRRTNWQCDREVLGAVHAVEVWNVRYDGKLLPRTEGIDFFGAAQVRNSALRAIAGLDLHGPGAFYPVRVRLGVERLDAAAVLAGLRGGSYVVQSPLCRFSARGFGALGERGVRLLRPLLDVAQSVRGTISPLLRRWTVMA